MTFRRKASAVLIIAAITGLLAWIMQLRSGPDGKVVFLGWTNVAERTHAALLFTPVTETRPHKNWFMFQFYRIGLDYIYADEEGRTNSGSLRENVYFYPHAAGTFLMPLPTNAVMLQFVTAETWLERRWDNISLPVRLPSRQFSFVPPVIPAEKMKDLWQLQE